MVGKLKHAWPDKGATTSSSTSSAAPPPSKPKVSVGKLNKTSPFAKNVPSSSPISSSNTPAKSSVKKWSPSSTPSKSTVSVPPKLKVKVKVTESSFKPQMESDQGVKEAFVAGEMVVGKGEDVSIKAVKENLQKDNFLEKLVLIANEGVDDAFVGILVKNLRDIRYLDLSHNGLSEASQMELLTAALRNNKVDVLILKGNCKISKANCAKLTPLLQGSHSICKLEAEFAEKPAKFDDIMDRNQKVGEYCERIKKANSTNADMVTRRLSVRDNDLVTTMIKAEENDPSITEIKIAQDPRFGHIQNTIVVGFAEGLRTNRHLRKLFMTGLDLGNVFLSGLAASIEWNFTLEEVILANNAFTSDGMSEFCQAMALNESIQKVDLRHQHSPIFSHSEEIVVKAMDKNHYVKEFLVEFKTKECAAQLRKILERNRQEAKTIDYDQKLIAFLAQEASTVEELAEQRKQEAKPLDIPDDDWDYYLELEQLAKRFQCRLVKGDGIESEDEAELTERQNMRKRLQSKRKPNRSLSDLGGVSKNVNVAATQFTGDGAFLNDEFITQFIADNPDDQSVTFDFSCQFKMFKRFPVESPDRPFIVRKFADTLLKHPRSKDFTHINMSNCFLGNDWLDYFCEQCKKNPKLLPKLAHFNLETNFISENGVLALSKCIASPDVWRYLQAIKLENQKFLLSSKAENALAKALYVNRSVVTVNLRVRNIHERTRIEKYVYRNTDLLRQARRNHKIKTGTLKERKRNKMEVFFDKIAANDPGITQVELVGDQVFIMLNKAEKLKAAKSFATNTHITSVKMSLLKLDDEFGMEFGKSLQSNSTIESVLMESNSFTGEAIKAIVGCLATNKSITELQLRHQNKKMASSDEAELAKLMGDNDSVIKFGVDIRHMQAKNDIERRIRQNQEKARKNRRKAPARSKSSEELIKSVTTQKILEKVVKGDVTVTAIALTGDQEYIKMEGFRKKEFLESLKNNTVVKSLTMNDLQLDQSFAEDLVAILEKNNTLESISLDKNWFTSLGVYTIVDAVIKKENVKRLSILKPRAKISNEETERLLEAMEKKSYLHELDIDFRDKAQSERLQKILKKNRT